MTFRDGTCSGRALVLEHLPGFPHADAGAVLWNLTCYPFGDEAQVRAQLVALSRYWDPARATWIVNVWSILDAEMAYGLWQARSVVQCGWCGSQEGVQGEPDWRLCATCRKTAGGDDE